MRVMVIIKADRNSEAGVMPDEALLAAMGKYNEELVNAGIMRAGDGLHPSSRGARVRFTDSGTEVVNGPFAIDDGLIAGYWLWQVESMDEAIAWLRRCPKPMAGEPEVEIRPLFEMEDFGAEFTPELREQEERLVARMAEQAASH
ncbi:YciI family protein [Chitinilyticum litopenaei]|uniref:YciI family protein n=1 Tax=Chitinilyticum litopenaei TaxID=1121276 RepID=UPI0003FD29F0|nr:YciI family protein [Chitinilyticum litopenaei]